MIYKKKDEKIQIMKNLRVKQIDENIFQVQVQNLGFWFPLRQTITYETECYNGFGENLETVKEKIEFTEQKEAERFIHLLKIVSKNNKETTISTPDPS